jgi:hypothetical protein
MTRLKHKKGLTLAAAVACLPLLALAACDDGGNGPTDASTEEVTILYETCTEPCPVQPMCRAGEVVSCCTCIRLPLEDAGRTSCADMSDYCGSGPVDLSCYKPDGYPTQGTPADITMHGVVDVYATGPNSDGITIQVYRENADGSLGALLGETVSDATCPDHEAELPVPNEVGDEAVFCPGVCQEKKPDTEDCRELGYYEIPGIPTNTPLVVKTSGSSATWKDMFSYNIWFFDNEIVNDRVYYKSRCLSLDDWRNIPVAAGDVTGVAPGKGAVAGEIHDCGDVRLYYATVAVYPRAETFTYFNGVEEKLYPELGRSDYGTNLDGLYAAIELDAGQTVRVTALARIAGEGYVSLGWAVAQTWPDALSSVSLRGTRPNQVSGTP